MADAAPWVSVVIPAYNAAAYIDAALASVFAQQGEFQLEVLVVDDGSSDDTAERAAAHPGVRCLRQPNRGPSAARNAGIAAARGEFVAFLDSDDLWPEGTLAAQLEVFRRHPEVALVFGDCRQFSAEGPWPKTWFEGAGFDADFFGHPVYVVDPYRKLLKANFINPSAAVVRRQVLLALGGFDEGLRYVEDLELWLRIAARYPIARSGRLCQWRRRHAGNASMVAKEAMILSYLEVLRRQRIQHGALWAAAGVNVRRRQAREYLELAALHLAENPRRARHWAWRSLVSAPSLRGLYCLVQSFAFGHG
ncbi:glycosyltransferase family 2 protein [Candidatus Methylocalor cossyra]|uniref:Glycosyl transferase n=1 Tax=Candidatus Methylocalor cossyra TaxID=3108543 RepID=A0ABM9NKC2_9GAMM